MIDANALTTYFADDVDEQPIVRTTHEVAKRFEVSLHRALCELFDHDGLERIAPHKWQRVS